MNRTETDRIADEMYDLATEQALDLRRSRGWSDRRNKHPWEQGMTWDEIEAQARQDMRDKFWDILGGDDD